MILMKKGAALILKAWELNGKRDAARIALQSPPDGIAEVCNLAYLDDGDPMHLLDIYYPEGTTTALPVIIDIHGGGFAYGDKELNKYYCLELAKYGFAVVNISYRLCPQVTIPDQIQDCFAAFRWLDQNGGAFFCDMNNVFVTGDSAGADLAAMSCSIMGRADLPETFGVALPSFRFRAAGFTCGAFSPAKLVKRLGPLGPGMRELCFGADAANPMITCTDASTMLDGTNMPPIYMISSAEDMLRPHSDYYSQCLRAHNISYTYRKWAKRPEKRLDHVFNVTYPTWPESVQTHEEMIALFRENMIEAADPALV